MVRLALIGCGKIAEKHLNAYKKIKDVEITVTDIVDKGEAVAERYGVAWNDDPGALIARDDIDAVDICVPTPVHADFILKALESGKHVFCEKPLARNLKEAMRIREKVGKVGRICMIGYLYRFHPAFQFVKEIIEKKIIGSPYYAFFRLGGRGSHKIWKHNRKTGGGAGNEMLVHMLDLVLWYFGEIEKINNLLTDTVLARRKIEGNSVDVEAEDLILLEMANKEGVRILCESDLITPSYMNYIEIHGDNGSIWTSILDYFPTIIYCNEPRGIYDRGHNFFKFTQVDLFEKELSHFVNSITNGVKQDPRPIDDSIKIMKILEATVYPGGVAPSL